MFFLFHNAKRARRTPVDLPRAGFRIMGVRPEKAAFFQWVQAYPADAPAGNNRVKRARSLYFARWRGTT
jgi:hypothetical protein